MNLKKRIAQRRSNKETRYRWAYNSFFEKYARVRRLYLFVRDNCKDRKLVIEAKQESIVSLMTAFEVFLRDSIATMASRLSQKDFEERLNRISDPKMLENVSGLVKRVKKEEVSLVEGFLAEFNFQRFNNVLIVFSALVGAKNPVHLGICQRYVENIGKAWDLRHRITHDVNLKMDISEDRLSEYFESVRAFAQELVKKQTISGNLG